MRLTVAILIVWLFLFYNIERLSEPIDITDVAYAFVPTVAVAMAIVPRLQKVSLGVLLGASILVFLVLKTLVKQHIMGTDLPLTTMEACAIALTIILSRWVSNGVSEFENTVARIAIGHLDKPPEAFSDAQAEMYRELKRARHHQRPLALLAIRVDNQSIQVALDRMVQEAQQTIMKQYMLANVAGVLSDKLEDYTIIAQRNDDFLVLIPEATADRLADFVNLLREAVSEKIGVVLETGIASFPEDAVTFDSLVERAIGRMEDRVEPYVSESLYAENVHCVK